MSSHLWKKMIRKAILMALRMLKGVLLRDLPATALTLTSNPKPLTTLLKMVLVFPTLDQKLGTRNFQQLTLDRALPPEPRLLNLLSVFPTLDPGPVTLDYVFVTLDQGPWTRNMTLFLSRI